MIYDSEEACRHFWKGRINHCALRVLLWAYDGASQHPEHPPKIQHRIMRHPARSEIEGNTEADRLVRGYTTNRASDDSDRKNTHASPAVILGHIAILQGYQDKVPSATRIPDEVTRHRLGAAADRSFPKPKHSV